MLNIRFGFGTWKEMVQLRRQIRKEREETLYKQQERRAAFFEGLLLTVLVILGVVVLTGMVYFTGLGAGYW